jgi:hypothetical protein
MTMDTDEMTSMVEPDADDPRIQAALAELRELIAARYPDATFATYRGEDPEGIRFVATVDVEDLDAVMDTFLGRLVDLQVEERLPVYVVLDQPLERIREQLRRKPAQPIEERLALLTL